MPTSIKKLEEFDSLVEGIETAMFTTRRHDGHLVSRPMATQKRISEADLWFVTDSDAHKLDDLLMDPHVNCSYYNMKSREWVSVSGVARVSRDRKMIKRLYQPDWKAWFGDEGGAKDGGPDDPRFTLILVEADSVVYMKNDKPRPVILFEVLKGMVTGSKPNIGETTTIGGGELMDRAD
ncbi:MAG TPA: pyridoxamine 5'-phosphate oxidase family protein [Gemmatimonadaceae bacterium]|nr:pyridoxamine 5'-phosphate oxidase family protein [Gemmatimonadaceae bacterium]